MSRVARKSLTDIISDVVDVLRSEEGSVLTVADPSRRIGASWESVYKALRIIEEVQSLWESGLAIDVFRDGRSYRVVVRRRFAGIPVEEVARRVRELYFPEPDEMDVLLVNLLKAKALDPGSAVKLREGPVVEKAMQLGYLAESNGYYLTELGVRAAEVTLAMYPELERM